MRSHAPILVFILGWLWLTLAPGCDSQTDTPDSAGDDYYHSILQFRRMRDQRFKTAGDSPIPPEARRQFQGLAYFPINPSMRFSVRLHRLQPADTVWIMTTHGRDRPALKVGYFEFAMHQKSYRLFAYIFLDQLAASRQHLFIPFRDAASGKMTYAGGRYLKLPINQDDRYILDFNLAYNPSCAYGNMDYICPIPPPENTLPVAILAGEKLWNPPQSP